MQHFQHSTWDKINTLMNFHDFDHEAVIYNADDEFCFNEDVRNNDDFFQTLIKGIIQFQYSFWTTEFPMLGGNNQSSDTN